MRMKLASAPSGSVFRKEPKRTWDANIQAASLAMISNLFWGPFWTPNPTQNGTQKHVFCEMTFLVMDANRFGDVFRCRFGLRRPFGRPAHNARVFQAFDVT
jgi:hypothetical protein